MRGGLFLIFRIWFFFVFLMRERRRGVRGGREGGIGEEVGRRKEKKEKRKRKAASSLASAIATSTLVYIGACYFCYLAALFLSPIPSEA